jgi:hypothetical protein
MIAVRYEISASPKISAISLLCLRALAFRALRALQAASFVRRQVAGDDMRSTTAWRKIAEISSSTQIGCRFAALTASKIG